MHLMHESVSVCSLRDVCVCSWRNKSCKKNKYKEFEYVCVCIVCVCVRVYVCVCAETLNLC